MELIVTDANFADVGLLDYTGGDFAFGADENDFQLSLSAACALPALGAVIYSTDGSVGGIVREHDSDDGDAAIKGSTWTGVFAEKVLKPPTGAAYWVVTGDVRDIAASLVSRLGLSRIVMVTPGHVGVYVRHTFAGSRDDTQQDAGRFMNGWAALWQLCYEHGFKPLFGWNTQARKIVLTIAPIKNHVDDETMRAMPAKISIKKVQAVNHLVCLGAGELADREVVDLYADRHGNISTSQTYTGVDEIAAIFDDSSAENTEELVRQGTAKLKEKRAGSSSIDIDAPDGVVWDIGDVVGGTDARTGISASATVTKKVVKLDGEAVSVEYKTSIRR